MIENYRSGFVWSLLRRDASITAGLGRAGFSGGWLDVALPGKEATVSSRL